MVTGNTQFNPIFHDLWLLVIINFCCLQATDPGQQHSPAERVYPVVSVTATERARSRLPWRSVRACKPERAWKKATLPYTLTSLPSKCTSARGSSVENFKPQPDFSDSPITNLPTTSYCVL